MLLSTLQNSRSCTQRTQGIESITRITLTAGACWVDIVDMVCSLWPLKNAFEYFTKLKKLYFLFSHPPICCCKTYISVHLQDSYNCFGHHSASAAFIYTNSKGLFYIGIINIIEFLLSNFMHGLGGVNSAETVWSWYSTSKNWRSLRGWTRHLCLSTW